MSLPNELHPLQLAASSGGYEIEQSLRFDGSSYLSWTSSGDGSRKLWTLSMWVKRSSLSTSADNYFWSVYENTNNRHSLGFLTSQQLQFEETGGGSVQERGKTPAVYRDASAWMHIVEVYDVDNGTADDRGRIYVNGQRVENLQDGVTNSGWAGVVGSSSYPYVIGRRELATPGSYFNGYIAEAHLVNNQGLDPDQFGEYDDNGIWRPIEYTGSHGTTGFYLKFDPSATNGIGHDHSGNGNHFTASGFDTTNTTAATYDVMSDTPTTNYATFNPVFGIGRQSNLTYSEGNLQVVSSATSGFDTTAVGTIAVTGKKYCEFTLPSDADGVYIGVMKANTNLTNNGIDTSANSDCWVCRGDTGNKSNNSSVSYGSQFANNDVIMLAIDVDNTSIWWGKNGTWFASGDPAANSNAAFTNLPSADDLLVICGDNYSTRTPTIVANFGQRAFSYTPPSGFKALNTSSLPAPSIKDGSDYFNTVLWTGNSTDDRNITVADNSGNTWQPDLVWIKARITASLHQHELYDAVRGATKRLQSNDTAGEDTAANNMQAFNSDGFQVGTAGSVNASSDGYVAWNWLEGASQGFDIINGTGGTAVNHNLGVAPDFVIFKYRDTTSDWNVYHKDATSTSQRLKLNSTAGVESIAASWTINSTNFAYGGGSNTWVAYLFSEVEGYSKFGSYVGNGLDDGPFVALPFTPAFVMTKNTVGTQDWQIRDNQRLGYNPTDRTLAPNDSRTENGAASSYAIDLLSNGFKIRGGLAAINGSGNTIVFAAFASSPFGGSGVSPATAR